MSSSSSAVRSVQSSFESSFGTKIAYQESGSLEHPTVVLIHGFPMDHRMWDHQVDALKHDFRVITFDLRGMGQSKTQDSHYTLEVLVDDFFSLLDHLKLEKVSVVGFSMGGYIALRAMERQAAKFKGLVLVDTQSAADSDPAKLKRAEGIRAIKTTGLKDFGQKFLQGAVCEKTRKENPALVEKMLQVITSNTPTGLMSGLIALMSRTDTTAFLSSIQVPTLIIVGDEDTITPEKTAQLMKDQISGSELSIVSDSGHFSPLEASQSVSDSLAIFLKKTVK